MRVFISYRRDDTLSEAQALYDEFAKTLGGSNVFLDLETFREFGPFRPELADAIRRSDLVMVLIGQKFLRGPILEDGVIRYELETAVQHRKCLVPILVDTPMPPKSAFVALASGGRSIECLTEWPAEEFRRTLRKPDARRICRSLQKRACPATGWITTNGLMGAGLLLAVTALIPPMLPQGSRSFALAAEYLTVKTADLSPKGLDNPGAVTQLSTQSASMQIIPCGDQAAPCGGDGRPRPITVKQDANCTGCWFLHPVMFDQLGRDCWVRIKWSPRTPDELVFDAHRGDRAAGGCPFSTVVDVKSNRRVLITASDERPLVGPRAIRLEHRDGGVVSLKRPLEAQTKELWIGMMRASELRARLLKPVSMPSSGCTVMAGQELMLSGELVLERLAVTKAGLEASVAAPSWVGGTFGCTAKSTQTWWWASVLSLSGLALAIVGFVWRRVCTATMACRCQKKYVGLKTN